MWILNIADFEGYLWHLENDGCYNIQVRFYPLAAEDNAAAVAFPADGAAPSADVNGDSRVNLLDLVAVASSFGTAGAGNPADVNADGHVDLSDLLAVTTQLW